MSSSVDKARCIPFFVSLLACLSGCGFFPGDKPRSKQEQHSKNEIKKGFKFLPDDEFMGLELTDIRVENDGYLFIKGRRCQLLGIHIPSDTEMRKSAVDRIKSWLDETGPRGSYVSVVNYPSVPMDDSGVCGIWLFRVNLAPHDLNKLLLTDGLVEFDPGSFAGYKMIIREKAGFIVHDWENEMKVLSKKEAAHGHDEWK